MTIVKCNAGFSLVEVMVAILILGVALVGLTHGITTALGSSKESELQTKAAMLAAGQIETLRVDGNLTDGEDSGDFGDDFPQFQWKQTIARTDIEGLHQVTVTVESANSGKMIYELQTMLFEPADDASSTNSVAGRKKEEKNNDL